MSTNDDDDGDDDGDHGDNDTVAFSDTCMHRPIRRAVQVINCTLSEETYCQ